MTMQYDILGNPIGDDGQPSVDQMQYELAKKGQAPRPLDKVTEHFKNIVTQFNPIMMPKVMQDVGTMGLNIGSIVASPYADILHNIQATGASGLHNLAGDEQSALEALARTRPVSTTSLLREPNLPVVREFEQGLGKAFEASKLPPLGPGSGLPGTSRVSPRPLITPNDVRVLGAEATRVGRQIGDIPTDFVNAQSGFQRIDPVTGQPVMGARIQSGVDRLGDIMEQRKMQGLTPIPGLPAALQPETSMYAVRPQGSRLTTPVVPETARGFSPPIDPANDMFKEVVGLDPERAEVTPTLLHSLNSRVQFNDVPNDRDAINGFRSFMQNKAQEMYPEAETPRQALEIFNAMHYDTPSRHAVENKMFDEFIQTPEGQQLLPNAVSSDEMAKRHDAATEGLKNMWGKYLVKNLGTEGNPLVKIAAEKGLTQLPAEDVIRVANEEAYAASANRQKAGMPVQGSFTESISQTRIALEDKNTQVNKVGAIAQDLRNAATAAGFDPNRVPDVSIAEEKATKLIKERNELQKKLDNLTLASAYEALEDAAVKPMLAETLLKEMQPSERPFYPGLKESAARGETSYKSAIGAIENTGFIQAAEKFYNDVLQGKIPANKAATYPVDKYIRENAEARIKVEQADKAKLEKDKTDVIQSLKDSAKALPADKKFGNVGVVELTKDTPVDIANREVAASTEALDICIGEGGSGKGTKNLFTGKKDPRYTPIVNLLTGEPNPNASRNTSGYVTELQRGEQLPMFRDIETGMPIAALQFHVASSIGANGQPMFNIGYASGAGNGRIEAKYVNGVRDYLNSRADDIAGIGNNLEDNAGIYDTTNRSSIGKARRYAQVSESELKAVDWDSMPRFMTANDIKQAVQGSAPVAPQRSLSLQEDIAQLKATLIDNIETVVNDAVNHSNLVNPEELERRLNGTFSAMQHQSFSTFFDDPIGSMNQSLELLRNQIDRRSNDASEISQEMVDALDNYAAELEAARDELLAQQQRDLQPAPQTSLQTEIQQHIQLRQVITPRLFAGNARVVNEALQEYSSRLQDYAANQVQNGMSPVEIADNVRSKVNEYRNMVLRGPTINTQNFTPDELSEYVSELRQMIDNTGRWIEGQQQQAIAPQTANLPAEVQQNIDRRNQDISNAYANALLPNSRSPVVNEAVTEFSDLLHSMSTNLFGAGFNTAEIVERLQDRIRTEITELSNYDRVTARGLSTDEASNIRHLLNLAYGDLTEVREAYQVPNRQGPATTESITTAIQTAFTPNTGSPTADAWLSQYGDVLANQIVEFENAGNNPAEVASLVDNEIRGQLHNLLRLNEQQTGLTSAENLMARTRLETAIGNIRFNATPPEPMVELDFEPDETHPANQPAQSPQRTVFDATVGNFINRQIQELRDVGTPAATDAIDNVLSTIATVAASANMFNDPQEAVRLFRQGATAWGSAAARQALNNIARAVELNHPTMQRQEPANEPYTMQSAVDMARDLFEQERTDANNFDIPSIEQSIYALREGLFDDDRIRRLSPRQQASFSEDVAFRLQNMLDELRGRRPDRNLVAEPRRAREAIDNAIANIDNDYGIDVANDVLVVTNAISEHVNPGDELSEYVYQLRRNRPGMSQDVREGLDHVADELESVGLEAPPNTPPPEVATITDRDRELYDELNAMLDNAIEEGYPLPDLGDNESVARLILNDEVGGDINNATDAERRRLANLVRQYGAHGTLPRGHKDGGQIRKYQDGGSTSDYGEPNNAALDAFDLMKLERWMSKRPEFRVDSKEFNDNTPDLERDDDAQVPRESTFDAKLKTPWEDDRWMQKNFNYRYRGKTFAKGGTVQPIPSVEQMKYELMKRS